MLRDWLGFGAGIALVVAAPIIALAHGPSAVAYAAGLAGGTLAVLTYPSRLPVAPDAVPQVESWERVRTALGLHGPAAHPTGRLFIAGRPGTMAPLDDGRAVYDGADGHATGLAFTNPMQGLVNDWLAHDPSRLRSLAAVEDDLAAFGLATGLCKEVRVLAEPDGLRLRFAGQVHLRQATAWALLSCIAQAAGKSAAIESVSPEEVRLVWLGAS